MCGFVNLVSNIMPKGIESHLNSGDITVCSMYPILLVSLVSVLSLTSTVTVGHSTIHAQFPSHLVRMTPFGRTSLLVMRSMLLELA